MQRRSSRAGRCVPKPLSGNVLRNAQKQRGMTVVTKNGFQRKRVLIDKDFQFKYLLTWIAMTMTLLAGLVLASVSMFFVFKVHTVNHLVIGNGICAALITVLSMRYMIQLSHRIAGPAFRLERVIRKVADGTYEGRVRLRGKDYLKHVAESVNYLIDRLDEHRAELSKLAHLATEVEQTLAAGSSGEAPSKQMAHKLAEKLTELSATEADSGESEDAEESETTEVIELEEVGV